MYLRSQQNRHRLLRIRHYSLSKPLHLTDLNQHLLVIQAVVVKISHQVIRKHLQTPQTKAARPGVDPTMAIKEGIHPIKETKVAADRVRVIKGVVGLARAIRMAIRVSNPAKETRAVTKPIQVMQHLINLALQATCLLRTSKILNQVMVSGAS